MIKILILIPYAILHGGSLDPLHGIALILVFLLGIYLVIYKMSKIQILKCSLQITHIFLRMIDFDKALSWIH